MPGLLLLLLLGLFLAAAGCAPRLDPPGPAVMAPRLGADHFIASDGRRLALVRHDSAPPRAVIVAAHGFNDYSNAFHLAGPWFAARGITLIAPDQRGFGDTPTRGLWPGAHTLARDLAELTKAVRAENPGRPVYLLGASMGAAVAVLAHTAHDAPADGLILAGPAFWGWSTMNPLYRASLWTAAHVAPGWRVTGEGLGRQPSDNIGMLRALARDPRMIRATRIDALAGLVSLMDDAFQAAPDIRLPALILFGARDEIVPEAPVRAAARRMAGQVRAGPVRYVRYRRGWHMLLRDHRRARVYADIEAWIADPEAPLPSGEEMSGEELALLSPSGHEEARIIPSRR